MHSLTLDEARRIALYAQGFDGSPRRTAGNWDDLQKTIERLHLLQIDSVNVLVRSHYLPLFARTGSYSQAALDARTLSVTERHCFECWAHEASLVPLSLHTLMRWRMERARKGDGIYTSMDQFGREQRSFLKSTLKHIEKNGPIRSSEVPNGGKAQGGWWGWSKGKLALETLFDQGLVTARERQGFERIYDITERVIPADVLNRPTPKEADSFRHLMLMAAQALGIGTEIDLRDYFRLPIAEARRALEEAVADGLLEPCQVEGWSKPAYIPKGLNVPAQAGGRALLSPFDPIVWNRERSERLFNFHYRIELYTPEHKRKYGYYVLPFLCGDQLAARVCLKSDREAGILKVNAAYIEPHQDHEHVATELAAELQLLSTWLGLGKVSLPRRGNLAKPLAASLKSGRGTSR